MDHWKGDPYSSFATRRMEKAHARGDASRAEFDADLTLTASFEDMEQFKKHAVYEKVQQGLRWASAGKGRTGTIWIDIDKVDEQPRISPNVSSTADQAQPERK
eukprot:8118056-Pyramimonas_sp.AAC.2